MKSESRNQQSAIRNQKSRVRNEKRNSKLENRDESCFAASSFIIRHSTLRLIFLLISAFCFLPSAFAGTHVTGVYSVGTSPAVMATVNGNSEYGLVFAQRNKSVTYNNIVYVNNVVTAYLDINGNLNDGALNAWIDLIPNANATPGDSYYVVTINIQGAIHSEIWIVPDQTNINVVSVLQSAPPPSGGTSAPVFFYQTLQQTGSNLTQRPALNLTGAGVNCLDNAGLLRTDCTITGSGSGTATTTNSGTVKSDVLAADPVVYLKTSSDTLLAGKVGTSRQVLTAAPLSGGGTLTADLTLTCPGCVTSVTANSPLLSSGGTAPAISLANQNANLVAAGPASGVAAAPTFRALVGADLPSPSATTLGGVQSLGVVASKWINTISTSGVPGVTQPNFTDLAGSVATGQTPLTTRGDLLSLNAALALSRLALGSSGQCLTSNGTDPVWGACSTGTVTSVALTVPADLTVAGSPVTSSGTFAVTRNNQNANLLLAGPSSGVAATPAYRALVGADLPSPSATTLGGVQSLGVVASKWINMISTSGVPSATQPAFADISGTAAKVQVPATTVFTDQANTFGAFLQKFQAGNNFNFVDSLDATKMAKFDLSNLTTATTRTVNVPDANSTLVQPSATPANQFANSVSAQGVVGYAQPGFANLSGTASDPQLANAYSGVGACAASKWSSTLTRNAAPTCTQPAFTDISGINSVASGGTGTSNGSITGTTALTFTAGGVNQNVTVTPSGTGAVTTQAKTCVGCFGGTPAAQVDIGAPANQANNILRIGIQAQTDGLFITNDASNLMTYIFKSGANAEKVRITDGGSVGIGTSTIATGQALEVNGGMALNTATAEPVCSATTRGTFWVFQGAAGIKDRVEVCAKDALDAYAWRTIY